MKESVANEPTSVNHVLRKAWTCLSKMGGTGTTQQITLKGREIRGAWDLYQKRGGVQRNKATNP